MALSVDPPTLTETPRTLSMIPGGYSQEPNVGLPTGTEAQILEPRERLAKLIASCRGLMRYSPESIMTEQFYPTYYHELTHFHLVNYRLTFIASLSDLLNSEIANVPYATLTELRSSPSSRSSERSDQSSKAEDDFHWFIDNQTKLAEYRGEFVAIFGKKVVGFGHTMKEAYDGAMKKHLPRRPLLAFVPDEEVQAY